MPFSIGIVIGIVPSLVVYSLNIYYMKDEPNRSKSPLPSLAILSPPLAGG